MLYLEILFWIGLIIVFYSYIGYGLLVFGYVRFKSFFIRKEKDKSKYLFRPPVTLVIAAYNEEEIIIEKIKNSLGLNYPDELLKIIIITDGSSDSTPDIVRSYPRIQLLHEERRRGKIAAMHRAMSFVQTPYVIFSDANTILNKDCIINIVRHYTDPQIGGVAGEKKVLASAKDGTAALGEGLYWKYESFLKNLDAEFYTVVGAAGELFSIRTELYEFPGNNILLDDFIISLRICQKGYRIAYEADAYAMESGSLTIGEEKKRKVRISAGAFQSIVLMKELLNIFKYPKLAFQYISHRVLRWTFCPLFLPLIFICNLFLLSQSSELYLVLFVGQAAFYLFGLIGWVLSNRNIKVNFFYAPYYFVFINFSLYLGFVRFLKGSQSALWEKAKRQKGQPV